MTVNRRRPVSKLVCSENEGLYDQSRAIGAPRTLGPVVSQILTVYQGFLTVCAELQLHKPGEDVNELHAMQKLHEQTLICPKTTSVLYMIFELVKVPEGKKHNKPATHKGCHGTKIKGMGNITRFCSQIPRFPLHPRGKTPQRTQSVHEYVIQTLKSNCPQYFTEVAIKNKKNTASGAGCGYQASRKLKPGALSLYVGNGQREAVEAIGNFDLSLPSGLVIVLNNCHYAPSITRGVISVSRLYEDGFINRFVNNTIQVSRNNMVYFSAIPRDGIFEIDLSNSYTNENSIYTVSNKRAKLDLDSALLWHCRLGHISKKRIEKLQHDGLINSTDLRAFEKCVPCMSGKMARKPYTHQVERAKDLLGLIHTDVCGPFKITSRQGASYFVTFTDDFSRYGYVYLLKHKHEVFETFKVFQKEVENQLGKTIKSLRSDRGGEYMSQEFLDHLKDHGIIAHQYTPYTPQQMVVSKGETEPYQYVYLCMSQTTLPKSF
ncbi:retrotransposon protein, putative, ty1-copia subclass [Tanacetum coccineum]